MRFAMRKIKSERRKKAVFVLFQKTMQELLDSENRVISTKDYHSLISKAKTQEEKDIYSQMYNYLIQKKQQEVIANEKY